MTFVCCNRCFDDLHESSVAAAQLWLKLCAFSCAKGMQPYIKGKESREFKMLEKMGYIVTTDHKDEILIRVKGKLEVPDYEGFFCARDCYGTH